MSEFFQKFAVSVEKLQLPTLLLIWSSYNATVHWKFIYEFWAAIWTWTIVLSYYCITVLSHLLV